VTNLSDMRRRPFIRGITRAIPVAVPALVLGLAVTGCGSDDSDGPSVSSTDVTVFAASSLTAAFTEIGEAFTAQNPDVDVTFNFAASSELVTQIGQGAPADIFASADLDNMTRLTDVGDAGSEPVVFTTNLAEIIVAPGNPEGITGVADLADDDLVVVQCAPEVPCGAYAARIFENAGVTVTPKSLEENVKAVVTKVTLGEADAGIVYATDVIAAGDDAEGVEVPADVNVVAEYPIALTAEAPNAEGGEAFIEFVTGEVGQEILESYGFVAP
jgi:molybdate transport system substrate-binding protein